MLDHLRGAHGHSQFHLATVRDGAGAVVGVVPLRVARTGLTLDVAGRVLWESRARAVHILGSLPLLPADPALHDLLFAALDKEFAGCAAIAMASVPTESFLWRKVHGSRLLQSKFMPYAVHGVRGCHTIDLPMTVEEYRAKFGAKKRYNLGRQVRLIRRRCGGLELRRIDLPHQVGGLVRAMNAAREAAVPNRWNRPGPPIVDQRAAEDLAGRGLLLSYLLVCDGRPGAALMGVQYRDAYHLDAIFRDRSLDRFSPGSTALHLAIEDLIRNTPIRRIDLGFGEPTYTHSSTNAVEPRASLLLMRKTLANRLRRGTHATFQSLVKAAKSCVANARPTQVRNRQPRHHPGAGS
jgi:hypothetical protein